MTYFNCHPDADPAVAPPWFQAGMERIEARLNRIERMAAIVCCTCLSSCMIFTFFLPLSHTTEQPWMALQGPSRRCHSQMVQAQQQMYVKVPPSSFLPLTV